MPAKKKQPEKPPRKVKGVPVPKKKRNPHVNTRPEAPPLPAVPPSPVPQLDLRTLSLNSLTNNDEFRQLKGTKRAFLLAFSRCGNITTAAKIADVDRTVHYTWLKNDSDYGPLFRLAAEEADEYLEEEARRRAVEGVRRLRFQGGVALRDPVTGQPYYEHEYSDTLLIFLMKGRMPDKYKDNHNLHVKGGLNHQHGGTVVTENRLNLSAVHPDVLRYLLAVKRGENPPPPTFPQNGGIENAPPSSSSATTPPAETEESHPNGNHLSHRERESNSGSAASGDVV